MFRSSYHECKYSLVVTVIILLSTLVLFYLHSKIIGDIQTIETSTVETLPLVVIEKEKSLSSITRIKRLPQAIIIGSRKSGTRALLKFLEVNQAIRSARREVHFFDKPDNFRLGTEWYRNQMPKSTSAEITIEKSPSYLVTPGVAEKVKAMNSSLKLVVILRDPVTRLISDYSQLIANKIKLDEDRDDADYVAAPGESIEYTGTSNNSTSELVWNKAEKSFEKYVLRPDGGIDDQKKGVKIGMYSMYLELWKTHFPVNQFHFVDGETLISDPFKELHQLEIFLGVEPQILPSTFVYNPKKGFFCLANSTIANLSPVETTKTKRLNRSIDQDEHTMKCLSKSKGRRHVKVREDLIEELKRFYAPYNEYLQSLTGKKFSWIRSAT